MAEGHQRFRETQNRSHQREARWESGKPAFGFPLFHSASPELWECGTLACCWRDFQGARRKRGKPAFGFPRFPQPRHFHSSPEPGCRPRPLRAFSPAPPSPLPAARLGNPQVLLQNRFSEVSIKPVQNFAGQLVAHLWPLHPMTRGENRVPLVLGCGAQLAE